MDKDREDRLDKVLAVDRAMERAKRKRAGEKKEEVALIKRVGEIGDLEAFSGKSVVTAEDAADYQVLLDIFNGGRELVMNVGSGAAVGEGAVTPQKYVSMMLRHRRFVENLQDMQDMYMSGRARAVMVKILNEIGVREYGEETIKNLSGALKAINDIVSKKEQPRMSMSININSANEVNDAKQVIINMINRDPDMKRRLAERMGGIYSDGDDEEEDAIDVGGVEEDGVT